MIIVASAWYLWKYPCSVLHNDRTLVDKLLYRWYIMCVCVLCVHACMHVCVCVYVYACYMLIVITWICLTYMHDAQGHTAPRGKYRYVCNMQNSLRLLYNKAS